MVRKKDNTEYLNRNSTRSSNLYNRIKKMPRSMLLDDYTQDPNIPSPRFPRRSAPELEQYFDVDFD